MNATPDRENQEPAARGTKDGPMSDITAIVAAHEAPLLRYAARLLKDEEHAQDVVQETFVRMVHQDRQGSLAAVSNRTAWLYRVARNLCLDRLRASKRRLEISLDEVPEDGGASLHEQIAADDRDRPDLMMAKREEMEQMRRQIMGLDPRSREIVLLKVEQGRSYKEIAEIMGLTVGNVGFILHQTMKKLARAMSESARPALTQEARP
jgi:RNA polymerase sigma-70 factor (ECF subfamily)